MSTATGPNPRKFGNTRAPIGPTVALSRAAAGTFQQLQQQQTQRSA